MKEQDAEQLLRKALAIGNDIKEMESIDVPGAYARAQHSIRKERRHRLYIRLTRYAAMLALPLLISSVTLGYLYFHQPESSIQYAEVTAATGSIMRYELPDRSVVWLNSGTTLRYPTVFSKDNRSVELKGEAYFEVEANPECPFYVNTAEGLSVLVYGTKFNVAAYEEENCIETVLEKGKVNVIVPEQGTVVLAPGDQLLYDKESHKLTQNKVDIYEKVAWKDGKLIFRNATLEEIFKRLERHFNVDIQFNNKSGKEYKYRATFRDETLSQILDYLAKSASMKWRTEEAMQQADDTFTKKMIIVNLY